MLDLTIDIKSMNSMANLILMIFCANNKREKLN